MNQLPNSCRKLKNKMNNHNVWEMIFLRRETKNKYIYIYTIYSGRKTLHTLHMNGICSITIWVMLYGWLTWLEMFDRNVETCCLRTSDDSWHLDPCIVSTFKGAPFRRLFFAAVLLWLSISCRQFKVFIWATVFQKKTNSCFHLEFL